MKEFFAGLGIFGAIVALTAAIVVAGLGLFVVDQYIYRFKAPWEGETERIQIVNSGEFRIRAYNHFFDLCASVQDAESRIDNATDVLATADPNGRFYDTYVLNLSGAKQSRADAVNQYNADARKDWTEANFLDEDLPWQVSPDYVAHGRKTVCATQ